MDAAEIAQNFQHVPEVHRLSGGYRNGAAHLVAFLQQLLLGPVGKSEDFLGAAAEEQPVLGEAHAVRLPDE